ncbi:MAG: hypothetical protein HZA82_03695, partial [Thaumarchaeota archaeon]|nr:hypothetical protein [Nitrososphaerota archaeon]
MQKTASIFLFLVLILGITQTPFLPSLQTDSSYNIQAPLGIAFADSNDVQDGEDISDEVNATENNEDTSDQNDEDHMTGNQTQAQQNAQEKISELQQRIDDLEQRLQSLLAMFESGKYFGT